MTIDRQSLGTIVSRVLGVYVLLWVFQTFSAISMMFGFDHSVDFSSVAGLAMSFFLQLGLSYMLLTRASKIGHYLMSDTTVGSGETSVDERTVLSLTFLLLGVSTIFWNIGSIPSISLLLDPNIGPQTTVQNGVIVGLFEILLGILLIKFRHKLSTHLVVQEAESDSSESIHSVAFTILGVYLTVVCLGSVVHLVVLIIRKSDIRFDDLIGPIQCLLGVLLIKYRRQILTYLDRI